MPRWGNLPTGPVVAVDQVDFDQVLRDLSLTRLATNSPGIGANRMLGNLGAMAWVVSSTASVAIRSYAAALRAAGYSAWVCDGVADQVEIQAAIDALPAGGGRVVLSEGTFTISAAVLVSSNTTLQGGGRSATVLFLAAASDSHVIANKDPVGGNSCITIRDLQVDGNRANQSLPAGATTDNPISGIKFERVIDSLIDNVIVYRARCYCIDLGGLNPDDVGGIKRVTVSNSEVSDAGDDNLQVTGLDTYDVTILNCISHDSGLSGVLSDVTSGGFEVDDGASRVTFIGCLSYNNAVNGFEVHAHSDGTVLKDIQFIGCTARGQAIGFNIDNLSGAPSAYNDGFGYINCQALSNTISFRLAWARNVLIQGGRSKSSESGLVFRKTTRGVTVIGWQHIGRGGAGGFSDFGIDVGATATIIELSIIGCRIQDCSGTGIRLRASTTGVVRIANNIIKNNGQALDANWLYRMGLLIDTAGTYDIIGNSMFDDQTVKTQWAGIGFNADLSASPITVKHNNLDGNLSYPEGFSFVQSGGWRANAGLITEKSGTATVASGDTTIVVNHGLRYAPTRVYLTPTTDTAGRRFWVSAKAAATFTITIDAIHTSDIIFDWKAQIGEG